MDWGSGTEAWQIYDTNVKKSQIRPPTLVGLKKCWNGGAGLFYKKNVLFL